MLGDASQTVGEVRIAEDLSGFRRFATDEKRRRGVWMRTQHLYRVTPKSGGDLIHDYALDTCSACLSPKYKGHIRSLMYRLFDKAMIWELIEVGSEPHGTR